MAVSSDNSFVVADGSPLGTDLLSYASLAYLFISIDRHDVTSHINLLYLCVFLMKIENVGMLPLATCAIIAV